jgi:Protein of unknown function (DUF3185)
VNGAMLRVAALGLLGAGIVLVVFGVDGVNAPSSDISRFFTGAPTDRAMWTLVGGIAMVVAGLAALVPGFFRKA